MYGDTLVFLSIHLYIFNFLQFSQRHFCLSRCIVFSLFICIVHLRRISCLSLIFFGTLHSDGYIFPFLLCLPFLFFSQLFVKVSSDNHFILLHFFFLGVDLVTTSCYKPPSKDLIFLIYLLLPLYNQS